jgi:hypothetical protein
MPVCFLSQAALEKVGHFRKMPDVFFKRIKVGLFSQMPDVFAKMSDFFD